VKKRSDNEIKKLDNSEQKTEWRSAKRSKEEGMVSGSQNFSKAQDLQKARWNVRKRDISRMEQGYSNPLPG